MKPIWRTGRKVLRTVYENDKLRFMCCSPEEATRIVDLLNKAELNRPIWHVGQTEAVYENNVYRFTCDSRDQAIRIVAILNKATKPRMVGEEEL